jgi:hypothetical protein
MPRGSRTRELNVAMNRSRMADPKSSVAKGASWSSTALIAAFNSGGLCP